MKKKVGKNGKLRNRVKGWNGTALFVPIWMQKKHEKGLRGRDEI